MVPVRLSRPKTLPDQFVSDYIRVLRSLSRKHKEDDAEQVGGALRVLRRMSMETEKWKRGELWIPEPDKLTGYYPMIEKVPYPIVRTMLRKNTSSEVRRRARGAVAASAEPFVPLFAKRPGTLNEAQRRSLLAHVLVSIPVAKGRHPALLGRQVPGGLEMMKVGEAVGGTLGTRSAIPISRMSPEDWERGFTMRKFSMSEDLNKAIRRRMVAKPRLIHPNSHPPKLNIKDVLKRATDTKVHLEPERYASYERQCYEDGFKSRVQELAEGAKKKVGRMWHWLLREGYLSTALRGATLGTLESIHTETGLGPTTVDKIPIQRIGLAKQFLPYPSKVLRGLQEALHTQLSEEMDPMLRTGLEKGLSSVVTELAARRALMG